MDFFRQKDFKRIYSFHWTSKSTNGQKTPPNWPQTLKCFEKISIYTFFLVCLANIKQNHIRLSTIWMISFLQQKFPNERLALPGVSTDSQVLKKLIFISVETHDLLISNENRAIYRLADIDICWVNTFFIFVVFLDK